MRKIKLVIMVIITSCLLAIMIASVTTPPNKDDNLPIGATNVDYDEDYD
ncbi:hypothetical protein [Aquimarina megaterium]|nr:hypothetical protein [Aquimarina megaterium]